MKLLFILACVIAVACAAPNDLLGSIKCTWGPSYWCQNFKQAKECQAIEHCKTHEWKSNDLCADCKSVVSEINSYAKNNGTQLLNMMNMLCDQLGQLAEECKLVVQLYGETVINTIVTLTADSEKLCQELSLCPKKMMQEVKHEMMKTFVKQLTKNAVIMHLKSVKEDYCEDCKLVFAEIKDVLENKDLQNDLVAIFEKLCAELGSYASECKSLVDQYGPLFIQELDSLIDPATLCAELGLCNSTKKVVAATLLKPAKVHVSVPKLFLPLAPGPVIVNAESLAKIKAPKSPETSAECILCEFIMQELEGMLKNNATEEEIKEALDKVCSLLPSTVRSECTNLVNKYADMILKFILADLPPDQICTKLGLCSGQKKLLKVSLKRVVKSGPISCDLCKTVIQYLEELLKTNATEEEIKKALDEVCSLFPQQLSTECEALVNEYGDLIIKLLLGEITPEEVCKALKLCSANQAGVNNYIKNKCYLGASYWCANVHNALKCQCSKETRKSNRNNKAENRQTGFWCKMKFFYENTAIHKENEPYEGSEGVNPFGDGNNTKSCQDCKSVINYFAHFFPKNVTKDQLIAAMKLYCTRFDPVVQTYCEDLVDKYGDVIAKILLGQVDPEKFCEEIGFCQHSKNAWSKMKSYMANVSGEKSTRALHIVK